MQQVLVRIDNVHDFSRKNESRFSQLQLFIDELQKTFEDTRILIAKGTIAQDQKNAEEASIEKRLRDQINELQKQVDEFRQIQTEQDMEVKHNVNSLTNNRIE